ncbi:MAG TPA: alpha/beta hydrolase [Candidatus Saccharimonas sp.]|nr:alpha/beta hydrolase [Candidatus Saccharimonas sp.]
MAGWWNKKRKKLALRLGITVVALAVVGYVMWLVTPQSAQGVPLAAAKTIATVAYSDQSQAIVLTPSIPATKALLFYPDARIDSAAYAYKLSAIAEQGVAIVIAKPIAHFALVDLTSVASYKSLLPNITQWFVGGHSLGGVKACQTAGDAQNGFKGLVLFAAYCNNDLSKANIKALSIIGSADQQTTQEQIDQNKLHMPAQTTYQTINGLNHAGFGNYGAQSGDDQMTINDDDARDQIAQFVARFVGMQ